MTAKTMLRKWHTFIGIIIVFPLTVLILTGVFLLYPNQDPSTLVAFTACDTGETVTATSQGLFVNDAKIPVRFPVNAISSLSCHEQTLDVAIEYGPIFSTQLSPIIWSVMPPPNNHRIGSIHRAGDALYVVHDTALWQYRKDTNWQQLRTYTPSMTQIIGMIHSGWWMHWSFRWVWLLVGIGWGILAISGCWIYFRMIQRNRTD